MTNTINNVPRELLLDCYQGCGLTARQTQSIRDRIDAILSTPSPAGVDGLPEFMTPALKAIGEAAVAKAVADQCYSVPVLQVVYAEAVMLIVTADAQAIIDGLRGEVEERVEAALAADRAVRHQQAQRIGELEGLLLEALQCHGVMLLSDPPQTAWKFHGLDGRIDAALSAGKEGE